MSKKTSEQELAAPEIIEETQINPSSVFDFENMGDEVDCDLEDPAEGTKFPFFTSWKDPATGETHFNEPTTKGYAIIRSMQPFFEAADRGRKKIQKMVKDPETRGMKLSEPQFEPLSVEAEKKRQEDAWDYAIMEIGGFRNKNTGKMYPSNRETKLKMIKKDIMITWLNECFKRLGNAGIEVKKAAEGN